MNGSLDFSVILHGQYGQMIIDGMLLTLQLALGSWLLAMVLAMLLVVIRLSNSAIAVGWWPLMSRITAMCPR